jgi:hypothetical protein
MLNRRNLILLTAVAICALVIGTFIGGSRAEEKTPKDFKSLQVIAYPTGMTGFFDTRTGALYVYDSNWEECVYKRQLTKLGDPMTAIADDE